MMFSLLIWSPLVIASETFEIKDQEIFQTKLGLSLQVLNPEFSVDNPVKGKDRSAPAVSKSTINVRLKFKGKTHDDFFNIGDIGTITRNQILWENMRITLIDRNQKKKIWMTTFRVENLGL